MRQEACVVFQKSPRMLRRRLILQPAAPSACHLVEFGVSDLMSDLGSKSRRHDGLMEQPLADLFSSASSCSCIHSSQSLRMPYTSVSVSLPSPSAQRTLPTIHSHHSSINSAIHSFSRFIARRSPRVTNSNAPERPYPFDGSHFASQIQPFWLRFMGGQFPGLSF